MVIVCPRCGVESDEFFYGPCKECRPALNDWAEQRAWWRHFLGLGGDDGD